MKKQKDIAKYSILSSFHCGIGDGRQKTDDRRQRTEDGGQMTEDGSGGYVSEKIESFRDLKVYQMAFALQQEIFEISKGFPKEELFSLTDQIRRSSRSIGGNSCPVK